MLENVGNATDCAANSAEARHRALIAIEDDLLLVEAAAETLHALHVAQSAAAIVRAVWFTAKGLEDAAARIRETLERPEPTDNAP
jgi:hypothetical protein